MNKITVNFIVLIVLITISHKHTFAQEVVNIKSASVIVNSVNGFDLSLDFQLKLAENVIIDPDYYIQHSENKPAFKVVYSGKAKDDAKCLLDVKPYVSQSGIGFIVSHFDNTTIKYFLAKDNQITIELEKDCKFGFLKSDPRIGENKIAGEAIISKEEINKSINEQLTISDSARSTYLSSLNNFYYFENKIDFGISPENSNNQTAYYANISLQNRYNNNILKCDRSAEAPLLSLYYTASARVSTNFKDTLNFINIYPVNIIGRSKDFTKEYSLKLGNESNQTFSNKRAAVDGSVNYILPFNIVNLTSAKDNRLRLRPIIDFGVKGYYDYSNDTSGFANGQVYLSGYYYIPVFNNYAIIFEGKTFYDFSKERNPNNILKGNYTVTVGAEIPKTGFKVMFKYVSGSNDINYKDAQMVVLGVIMDLFQDKASVK